MKNFSKIIEEEKRYILEFTMKLNPSQTCKRLICQLIRLIIAQKIIYMSNE